MKTTPAMLVGLAVLAALPAGAQQGKAGPPLGTVTGTVTLDGKPVALHHAVAVLRPDVFDEKKPGFTVAFTAAAMTAEALPMETAGDRLRRAVKAGIVLEVGQDQYCKIIVRDPGLGGAELQKMGGFICTADSITSFGPDRVAGTVTSAEEDVAGHKLGYTLHFNAPVAKDGPPAPGRH